MSCHLFYFPDNLKCSKIYACFGLRHSFSLFTAFFGKSSWISFPLLDVSRGELMFHDFKIRIIYIFTTMLTVIGQCHPHLPYLSTHQRCLVLSVALFLSACKVSAVVLQYKNWSEGGFTHRKARTVNTKQRWFVTSCCLHPWVYLWGGRAGGEQQWRWGHQGPPYLPGTEFLMCKAPTNAWAAWCCHPGIFYHWSNISRQLL